MGSSKSGADAFHTLVTAFGTSFAPRAAAPTYEARLEGPLLRVTTDDGELVEHASEWKRLCGLLWVRTLPSKRARALRVLLPTLSEFDGSVWAPMTHLLEDAAVASAVRTFESLLRAAPVDALCCRYSASFGKFGGELLHRKGKVARALDDAFEKRGALRSMELVKLALAPLDSANPLERLQGLFYLLHAMRESPGKLLGIHRLLVRHVLPLCRQGTGLWREAAMSVIERWVPSLVSRAAYQEALPLIDVLLDYGVAVPRFLAARYECLLALGQPEEAKRTLESLRAIADARGVLPTPINRAAQLVDDIEAVAQWKLAKLFGNLARGEPAYDISDAAVYEKRLTGEPAPPALTSREASKRSRAHAQAALTILERRAALPPAVKIPLNYAFFIDASKKWLRA